MRRPWTRRPRRPRSLILFLGATLSASSVPAASAFAPSSRCWTGRERCCCSPPSVRSHSACRRRILHFSPPTEIAASTANENREQDYSALPQRESSVVDADSSAVKTEDAAKTNATAVSMSMSTRSAEINGSIDGNIGGDDGDNSSGLARFVHILVSLKERLYARIMEAFRDLYTLVQRSVRSTENWVRDDAVGQLVSSALALVMFFGGVAWFAAWNIEVLGGKKWSGPTRVTVPTVRAPPVSGSAASSGIKFQKPKWNSPVIRTSYDINPKE